MKTKKIPLFPKLLLELHANCNRDCFFCNRPFDNSGKRLGFDGKKVMRSMPTEKALQIMDEAVQLGFQGGIAFHHFSEPFLDSRIIDMAVEAKKRGMHPYEHTNGDVLRNNDELCKEASQVFEYIVVGIYDAKNEEELKREKIFWKQKLKGTQVRFSVIEGHIFPRTQTPFNEQMIREKKTYPKSICTRPLKRLIIHYDGNMALCCEDMKDEFHLGNAFETSIENLWYSDKHVNIINELKKGKRENYKLCANCPIPPPPQISFTQKIIKKIIG